MRKVAILGGSRIPFVKSGTKYARTTNQEMMTAVLNDLVQKFKLENQILGDVGIGGVMINPYDWNLARECVLGSRLHPHTPGYNAQRACGTSFETSWHIALKIAAGQIEVGIGGGTDTNSDLPIAFPRSFSWKMMALNGAKSFFQKIK